MSAACPPLPTSNLEPVAASEAALRPPTRHPRGFYVLCLAVLCERWAGYLLASSMVFMLGERYGYARADTLRIAGLINAATYLGTLPGGLLSDRILGAERAMSTSMVLLALGYAALTFWEPAALWISLVLLVLGSSLFKPSTQASIARLYAPNDPRLDAAQILFYVAINAGAALGALLAGLLVRSGGWSVCYALAAAVMLTGRAVLFVGRDTLRLRPATESVAPVEPSTSALIPITRRAAMIAVLTLAMLIYTVCYAQVEGSLLLWAQDKTDRFVWGFEVPAAWFIGLPAVLVLALAPLQLALLSRLQRRLGTQRLVAGGLFAVALAYVLLIPAVLGSPLQRVSMGWLVGCLTLLVIGELLVAPLGLSLLLRLAPRRWVGAVVGAWYVAGALGFALAGELGALWVQWSPAGVVALLVTLPLGGAGLLWLSYYWPDGWVKNTCKNSGFSL